MTIRTLYIPAGGGFDSVTLETTPAVDPGPCEIAVRLRARSTITTSTWSAGRWARRRVASRHPTARAR